jgi:cytidyltransferase-like protein
MKVLVVYPGRFQPFHKGHAQVYKWLKSKFGDAVIATSDKVELPKSPFNFKEKVKMMTLAGVPSNSIKQVTNPYIAREILKDYDPKTTVLVFAVSQKDMEEDPRFSFKPTKSGNPSYLQPYAGNEKKLQPFGDASMPKGYVIVTPTFTFDVLGKPATSASELRKQFVSLDNAKQKEFVKDLFGKYDASVHKLLSAKLPKPKTLKQLKEEITRKELAPMLDSFVSFASDKLGLKSMPTVRYKTDDDSYNSFAAYNPSSNELSISTMNRHPMDIFRSVAHELVHHKQNEDGRLGKDIEKEGATGSDIENEANSEAGKIMRWFAKANPDMFGKSYVVETNTAAIGGGIRGLGNVTGEVSPTGVSQYVITNQTSGLWYDDGIDRYWLDKKGSSEYQKKAVKGFKAVRGQLSEGINDPGKLKAIFLAGGPGSGKDYVMNSTLAGEGLKEINSDVAFEYLMQKNGLDLEMPDEERVERDIVRGRAKNITKEQERLALAGRLGLIINGTADDLEKIKTIKQNLEADGYETMMVFVNTSNEVSRERNVERGKMGKRKVPDGTDKQGVPDNSPNIRQQKWDLAQKNIGELQKIFGNEKFAVIDNTADVRKVGPEEKEKIQANFNRIRRMAQQFVRSENQNPAAAKWIEREARNRGITGYQEPKRYKTLTQIRQNVEMPSVIHKPDNDLMNQARRLGLSYYGFGRFGRKVNGINKVLFHSQGGKLVKVQLSEDLRNWFSKTHPEGNWKRVDTKGNIKGDCAREPGEGKPKCMPASRAYSMSKKERAASARRKRREDPVADRSGKGNKPIMVKTESVQKAIDKINRDRMSEQVLMEKNKPTNPELWSRAKSMARKKFDVYPSAYANGWAAKWYKSKGGGWTSVNEEKDTCWDGYEQKGMKKKGNRMVPNCVPVNEAFESFVAESKKKTPWQKMVKALPHLEKNAEEAKKAKEELMRSADKLKQEAMEASVQGGYAFGADGIGPTIGVPRAGTPYGFGYGSAYSMGLSESIQNWMSKESTQQKYMEKYGDLWEEKLVETALKLENAGCGCEHSEEKKSVKKLREGMEGGVNNMSPIPTQRKSEEQLNERGADSKGLYRSTESGAGLTRKGAKHFGIKTAVTTPPSKLKKGGKAWKRRKSFCARMGGMKGPMKDEKGRPTRKAMSLRRWNCEE